MPQSPSVLFYTADFKIGVEDMTLEQVGMYILMLCKQHQTGPLSTDQVVKICGKIDPVVMQKFSKDKNGNFYNKRMALEIEKRSNYCKSRGNNRKKGNHMKIISKSYDNHMDNDNDNDNNTILDSLDLNKKRSVPKFQKPTIEEVCQHMGGTGDLAERFWNYYESKGWMVGKVKMKNWKAAANNWKKTTFEATKRTNKKLSNYEQGIINQRETIRNAGQDPDQFAPLPQHLKDAGYA